MHRDPSTARTSRDSRLARFAQDDKGENRDMATIELESMAIAMPEVKGHPNRAAFRGVLTVVDAMSQRAPSGSGGRRVLLTKGAAETALPSLLGMALDYAPSFDRHDVRRKVGMITRADVVGRNLEIGGHLFARDFPEVIAEIRKSGMGPVLRRVDVSSRTATAGLRSSGLRPRLWKFGRWMSASAQVLRGQRRSPAHKPVGIALHAWAGAGHGAQPAPASGSLGMSYEITGAQVIDAKAKVWILTEVTFTGAAILRRDKAAYQDTWIELV